MLYICHLGDCKAIHFVHFDLSAKNVITFLRKEDYEFS